MGTVPICILRRRRIESTCVRQRKPVIGIIGAGEEALPAHQELGRTLGERVARRGWVLLTGGRDAGVMAAASAGARAVTGAIVVGILPNRDAAVDPNVDVAIFTDAGHGRNNINVLSSDVVIACGVTGAGTLSEIALAIKNRRPLVVIGADGDSRLFLSRFGAAVIWAESPEDAIAACEKILGR
jgi:uncharacterized protein (TIGR00725 family)